MARILADREIRRLLGTVLVDSEEKLLNPNGHMGSDLNIDI